MTNAILTAKVVCNTNPIFSEANFIKTRTLTRIRHENE